MGEMLREDFIEALLYFTEGRLSRKEAIAIADTRLRVMDFVINT
jgi:hypothetical protein